MAKHFKYHQYLGRETLKKEYKEFTFHPAGLKIDKKIADDYCYSNEFNFNEIVIKNIEKYIEMYLTVNACASFNSNINSRFYIGVNDDGFVKGIPYKGDLPIKEIEEYIYKKLYENLLNPSLGEIDFKKYVKINISNINYPKKPKEKLNHEYSKYLRRIKKYKEKLEKYDEEMKDWRIRFAFVNQKLFKIINNIESRIILIEFIRNNDPTSPVIELLKTDYKEIYQPHEVVLCLKEDITSPYYWVTRWKDMMIKKLRKERPPMIKLLPNVSINLIMNVSDMLPWWIHYNEHMTLNIIEVIILSSEFGTNKFKILPPKFDVEFPEETTPEYDNLFSYYDISKKKWLKCRRIIFNGGPSCFPI